MLDLGQNELHAWLITSTILEAFSQYKLKLNQWLVDVRAENITRVLRRMSNLFIVSIFMMIEIINKWLRGTLKSSGEIVRRYFFSCRAFAFSYVLVLMRDYDGRRLIDICREFYGSQKLKRILDHRWTWHLETISTIEKEGYTQFLDYTQLHDVVVDVCQLILMKRKHLDCSVNVICSICHYSYNCRKNLVFQPVIAML